MSDHHGLAERFESERPRLRALAYRMLGRLSAADDAVQEAWLRLSRADAAEIDNPGAWLTVMVSRICLDMIRSRDARAEDSIGSGRRSRGSRVVRFGSVDMQPVTCI